MERNEGDGMRTGDVLSIRPEHGEAIRTLFDKCRDSDVAFQASARLLRISNKNLWDAVSELYPETKGTEMRIIEKSMTIICTGYTEAEDGI